MTVPSLIFRYHDEASAFLVKHLFFLKKIILVSAHLSLLLVFLPEVRKDMGSFALALLIGILFLSPLSKLFRTRLLLQLMSLRREIGIMMAYAASVHALGYFFDPDWADFFNQSYLSGDIFSTNIRYVFGFFAYILTLPLLLTSNTLAHRLLGGKNWKRLHMLVYPLFALVLFHKFLRPGTMHIADIVAPTFVLLIYVFIKVLAWKNFLTPLQKSIDEVARQYREYAAVQKNQNSLS